ncbi:hypothetical protein Hdeb2414_s0018g00515171 [Helianthus debilis subsp. tardiflorus]
MGNSKFKVNIAKFAAENSAKYGVSFNEKGKGIDKDHNGVAQQVSGMSQAFVNQGGGRLYGDLFKKEVDTKASSSRAFGDSGSVPGNKVVVVPDRTAAFKEFFGISVVGRTVNLETLVDFDKLLRIANVPYSRIQYLGGLFLLISFVDVASANSFLENRDVWGPWFSKVEAWKGQSLPMERVAWLRLIGIPLHLLDADVFSLIGDLFGKVLHYPKCLDDDHDLSLVRVGVLAGEACRIKEVVSVTWKNRNFRVLVEEELDAWVPDCLGFSIIHSHSSGSDSSLNSSPVVSMSESVNVDEVGTGRPGKSGEDVSSPIYEMGNSHADGNPMRGEREGFNVVENSNNNNEVLKSAGVGCSQVNADKDMPFMSVPKENDVSRKKPFNILKDKHKPKPKSISPEVSRPKKRARSMLDESFDHFGILGRPDTFMSLNGNEEGVASGVDTCRNFDLNNSDAGSGGVEDRGGSSSGGDEVRGEVPTL